MTFLRDLLLLSCQKHHCQKVSSSSSLKWPCWYLVAGAGFGSVGSYRAARWQAAGSAAAACWSSVGGGLKSSNTRTSARDAKHKFNEWMTHPQSHLNSLHSRRRNEGLVIKLVFAAGVTHDDKLAHSETLLGRQRDLSCSLMSLPVGQAAGCKRVAAGVAGSGWVREKQQDPVWSWDMCDFGPGLGVGWADPAAPPGVLLMVLLLCS